MRFLPRHGAALFLVVVAGAGSGAGCGNEAFVGEDAGVHEDAGVWEPGEVLTCGHEPLPAMETIVWDLADDFPERVAIGSNYLIPSGAENVWALLDDGAFEGSLSGTGDGDLVGHAIRTDPEVFFRDDTVAAVIVRVVAAGAESPGLFCRMETAEPPGRYYGALLLDDRLSLVEDGNELESVSHEGLQTDTSYLLVLACQDRSEDTLVSAFLFDRAGDATEWNEVGCVYRTDGSAPGAGSVALGVQSGQVVFDDLRVLFP